MALLFVGKNINNVIQKFNISVQLMFTLIDVY